MTINETTLASLRAAGGMIGETNLASWQELVEVFKPDGVSWAMAQTRRELDTRQVTATQVAKTLRYSLGCHEPARKSVEHSIESKATPAPRPIAKPMTTAAPHKAGRGIDYLAIIRGVDSVSQGELARAACVTSQSARNALDVLIRRGEVHSFSAGDRFPRYRASSCPPLIAEPSPRPIDSSAQGAQTCRRCGEIEAFRVALEQAAEMLACARSELGLASEALIENGSHYSAENKRKCADRCSRVEGVIAAAIRKRA